MDGGHQGKSGGLLERLYGFARSFVPPEIEARGHTATLRATALVLLSPLFVVVTLAPALAEFIDGHPTPLPPVMASVMAVMFLATPLVLRRSKSADVAGGWMMLSATAVVFAVIYRQHGLSSVVAVWLLAVPTVTSFFFRARLTMLVSALVAIGISSFWLLEMIGWPSAVPAVPESPTFRWLNLMLALLVVVVLTLAWDRIARRLESERGELDAQLRRGQKLETVGMLAGGIAHDFNNILAAILCHASLLESELEDPGAQRRINAIVDSSRRAAVLVEQMLAYAGRSQTHTGAIDVPQLVREVVELVQPGLHKNTELVLALDQPTPRIAADPVQIQQIAMNLVTNASEALEGKRGRVWIEVLPVDLEGRRLTRRPTPDDFVMLQVRDEGCGIPPEKLENIFDPFFTTKPSGHGLGLAAVLGIVRAHGGDIEVDSTVGKGTRFRVLIPCPDALTLANAERDDAPRARIRLPTAASQSRLSGPQHRRVRARPDGPGYVLIVDDEEMVRELACEVLALAGIETLSAFDGDEGLRVFEARGHEIDLVILDRTMPGLDGLELLAKMRQRNPNLPAVISSGYADDAGSRKLSSLGIDAVLQKPWAPSDLVQLVGELGMPTRSKNGKGAEASRDLTR